MRKRQAERRWDPETRRAYPTGRRGSPLAGTFGVISVVGAVVLLWPLRDPQAGDASAVTILRGYAGPSPWRTLIGLVLLAIGVWLVVAWITGRFVVGTRPRTAVAVAVFLAMAAGSTFGVHHLVSQRLRDDAYRVTDSSLTSVVGEGDGGWSRAVIAPSHKSAVDWEGGRMYVQVDDERSTAFVTIDLSDGSVLQTMRLGSGAISSPHAAVDDDGWLVWGGAQLNIDPDGDIRSVSADTIRPSTVLHAVGRHIDSSFFPLRATPTLVVTDASTFIAGLDVPTGDELWRVDHADADDGPVAAQTTADGGTLLATAGEAGPVRLRWFAADGTLQDEVEIPGPASVHEPALLHQLPDGRAVVWNLAPGGGDEQQVSVVERDGEAVSGRVPGDVIPGQLTPNGDGFVTVLDQRWTTFTPSPDGSRLEMHQAERLPGQWLFDTRNELLLRIENDGTVSAMDADGQVQDTFHVDRERFRGDLRLGMLDRRLVVISESSIGALEPTAS